MTILKRWDSIINQNILQHKKEYTGATILVIISGFFVFILMYYWPELITSSLSLEICKTIVTVDGILIAFFGVSYFHMSDAFERHIKGIDFMLSFCVIEFTFTSFILFSLRTMSLLSLLEIVPKTYGFLFPFAFMVAGLAQQAYLVAAYCKLV